jgi:hypothetical protein
MKEFYRDKVIEYKNHFFTMGEYEMAASLRNLEVILLSESVWIQWDEKNFLNEIRKFCDLNKQEWILRDLKIGLIGY